MDQCVDNVLDGLLFEAKNIASASNELSKEGDSLLWIINELHWRLIQDSPVHTTSHTFTQPHKASLSCRGSKCSAWVNTDRTHFHRATHIPLHDWKTFAQRGWQLTHRVQSFSLFSSMMLISCYKPAWGRRIRGADISAYMWLTENVNMGMTFAVMLKVKILCL